MNGCFQRPPLQGIMEGFSDTLGPSLRLMRHCFHGVLDPTHFGGGLLLWAQQGHKEGTMSM